MTYSIIEIDNRW